MKKEAWQAHVDAYNSCKQSVTTYASQHGFFTAKCSTELGSERAIGSTVGHNVVILHI
jgi:hypothetical protein